MHSYSKILIGVGKHFEMLFYKTLTLFCFFMKGHGMNIFLRYSGIIRTMEKTHVNIKVPKVKRCYF